MVFRDIGMSNGQNQFAFARMTPAEYRDDCQQMRLCFR